MSQVSGARDDAERAVLRYQVVTMISADLVRSVAIRCGTLASREHVPGLRYRLT